MSEATRAFVVFRRLRCCFAAPPPVVCGGCAALRREYVWATSWGASTRLIGALVMSHSDDIGLVLPPRVAPTQVVIVQVSDASEVAVVVSQLAAALKARGVRVAVDTNTSERPGKRYFDWERKARGPCTLEPAGCVA